MGGSELLRSNTNKSPIDALKRWFSEFSQSFCAVKIGKITKVNYSNQTVDVQVLNKMKDESDPRVQKLRDYPLLQQVPFVVLGGGDSHLTFPIKVGDNCLLLFCDYEIDRWWDTGEPLPANFDRRHNISDAFALVGVHSVVDLIQGYSNYVRLQYSDNSGITIGDEITLQSDKVTATKTLLGTVLEAGNGATGTFTSADSHTITVTKGIITKIA